MATEQLLPVLTAAVIGGGVSLAFKVPGAVAGWWVKRSEAHEAQVELLQSLKRELFPNHGTSLRDAVDKCAADSKAALALGEQGIAVANEVRAQQTAHLSWHSRHPEFSDAG